MDWFRLLIKPHFWSQCLLGILAIFALPAICVADENEQAVINQQMADESQTAGIANLNSTAYIPSFQLFGSSAFDPKKISLLQAVNFDRFSTKFIFELPSFSVNSTEITFEPAAQAVIISPFSISFYPTFFALIPPIRAGPQGLLFA